LQRGDRCYGLGALHTHVNRLGLRGLELGLGLHHVGLGGMVPTRIPRYNRDGVFEGYERQEDETLTTALNERTLRYMAQMTGGQYLRIHSG
jgi:hypothetical protein